MLTLTQMLVRLLMALFLGGLMGLEREIIGKEAGIRTAMLVSGGAAIFTMISIVLPYLFGADNAKLTVLSDRVISNIVVGIGFLGAGIIIQTGERVRGLTTAALIWTTAAVGTLVGLGLWKFAAVSAILISGLLYVTRIISINDRIRHYK